MMEHRFQYSGAQIQGKAGRRVGKWDREGKEASKEYIIKEVTSAGSLSLLPV